MLLQIITTPKMTPKWRTPVGKLFGQPNFFIALSRHTLPLWSRVANAWLGFETPKAAIGLLLSGKYGKVAGWFASKASEAEAFADLLRRLSFALWVGEDNQYVGALQGMLIDRVVAGFKFGQGNRGFDAVRWVVQVQALLAMRVLAVRVATEHLISLWPIAMAELQRVLLAPHATRPALLLAACQLIDTVLTVHPDDFSQFGWMFVPQPVAAKAGAAPRPHRLPPPPAPPPCNGHPQQPESRPADGAISALGAPPADGGHRDGGESGAHLASPELSRSSSPPADVGPHAGMPDPTITNAEDAHHANGGTVAPLTISPTESGTLPALPPSQPPAAIYQPPSLLAQPSTGAANSLQAAEYVSLLEPLARLAPTGPEAARPPARRAGLLRPSADGRRRALGMRTLQHASDLAYFAAELRPIWPPLAPPALGRGGPAVARAAPRVRVRVSARGGAHAQPALERRRGPAAAAASDAAADAAAAAADADAAAVRGDAGALPKPDVRHCVALHAARDSLSVCSCASIHCPCVLGTLGPVVCNGAPVFAGVDVCATARISLCRTRCISAGRFAERSRTLQRAK